MSKINIAVGENIIGAAETRMDIQNPERGPDDVLKYDLELNRVRFDRVQIAQAFVGNLAAQGQHHPLQITQEFDDGSTVVFHNAWITGMSYAYETDDWIIVDTLELEAEDKSE